MHAVNNVIGADVFMLAHFKAASKKAGKERTGDFSMEDFRALAGIDDAETNQLLVGQSALGQKDFHALTFLPSERGFEELVMACHGRDEIVGFVTLWSGGTEQTSTGATVLSNGHFKALRKTETGYWDIDSLRKKNEQVHHVNFTPLEIFKMESGDTPLVAAIFKWQTAPVC